LFVQEVAEDFCGHDEDLGIGLELDVACHDANTMSWKLFLQIGELLIGQRFDRIGGKDSLAFAQGFVNGYFSDRSLP